MNIEWTEEVWRGLIESAPDALVMVDAEGTIVFVSSQVQAVFGYRKEELLQKKIEVLLPSRYREKHVGQRSDYFNKPRMRPMGAGLELFGLHKSGAEIPIEISLSPLKTPHGDLVTAAIRDISDRKRVQEELRKAREIAEAASRSKSEFLANMSHEIRTPLAGILGYAEMIAYYCSSDDERKSYMEKIQRCADTLTELINDILDLSKVEAGALKVERVPFGVVGEVENVIGLFQSSAMEKKISFDVHYERPFPAQLVADPTRVRQIISNLLGNAVKFTDRGGVTLKVSLDPQNSERLWFSIIDTGCGLSEEQQSRLFQPFVQADSSTTRKYGGTGLGLALSRRLAEAMGGELKLVHSQPGLGSTFRLELPILKAPLGAIPVSSLHSGADEDRSRWPRLDGIRVLVAEDNLDNQDLLRRFLEAQGAQVEMVGNGRGAVEKASSGLFHIVLMDVQMPEMDGYEATRTLRSQGIRTPIIALTAHAMSDEKEKCLASGCDEFLSKPLDVPRLIKTVAERGKKN